MKTEIRIGIIGTGVGIRTHYKGFKDVDNARIVGIVGSTYERALEFATKFNIDKAYNNYIDLCNDNKIDLVCITSPNVNHFDELIYALQKDKHILAEKPLVMSIDQNNFVIEAARKSSKLCLVDHQLRFNPYIIKVKELIASGKLGRIYHIKMHQQGTGFSNPDVKWMWSFDEAKGGGVRLAMASHLLDTINYWLPKAKYYNVSGAMDTVIGERKDLEGNLRKVNASSFFSASISLENMLNVHLSATASAIGLTDFEFSIFGTNGEVHFDLTNKLRAAFLGDNVAKQIEVLNVFDDEKENKVSIFSGSFRYLAPKIIHSIETGSFSSIAEAASFTDALKTQVILDAIKKSALEGKSVVISDGYKCNSTI